MYVKALSYRGIIIIFDLAMIYIIINIKIMIQELLKIVKFTDQVCPKSLSMLSS